MAEFIEGTKNERDYLLSVVLSLNLLAKAEKLTNAEVHDVTRKAIGRIRPQLGAVK